MRERFSYRRIPCDPPPQALADRLTEAKVASAAAKKIATFDRLEHQHAEHRKAQIKVVLGAVGIVLSVGPSIPGAAHACGSRNVGDCAARISALVGAMMAMGVTAWSFYDLYKHPSRLSEHVASLNAEIARSMMSRNGQSAVDNLFDLYRSMSAEEKIQFKALLHERAQEPKMAQAVRRMMERRQAEADAADEEDVRIEVVETPSLA